MSKVFELLDKSHNRKQFDCGKRNLNLFLQRHARKNNGNGYGKTFVLTDESKTIYGFFTLSTAGIEPEKLPQINFPYPEVPCALIGRLAVDKNHQGNGYGEQILIEALNKVIKASENIGIYCITVEAKDAKARDFYKRYGFMSLTDNDLHLFMPISKVLNSM